MGPDLLRMLPYGWEEKGGLPDHPYSYGAGGAYGPTGLRAYGPTGLRAYGERRVSRMDEGPYGEKRIKNKI